MSGIRRGKALPESSFSMLEKNRQDDFCFIDEAVIKDAVEAFKRFGKL
ncbi:MAG: hypothetical protein H6881_04455 [Rhodobiaceae bacterium]|nr:hypothetical protein [Rhodobiaceae bacterium]